jgi:squalene-associated FAD-dependent desaturase
MPRTDAARLRSATRPRVIVAGGGVAGIASAVRLSLAGVPVLLIEARRRLGGRASSFHDPTRASWYDNSQHIALGCCTAFRELCALIEVDDQFDWHTEQRWIEAGGRTTTIKPGRFPPPLHYAEAFLGAAFLSAADKAAISRAMIAIRFADRHAWRSRTFADFLRGLGQPRSAIDRFWSPVVVSACNLHVDRVSASPALKVFQEGFLAGPEASAMGIPRVPLIDLYRHVTRIIEDAGGCVHLGLAAEQITPRKVVAVGGETFTAQAVVCALPFEKARHVLVTADGTPDPRLLPMADVGFSTILGVHMQYDRPVLPYPSAVLVERGTHWLFRRGAAGDELQAVISASDDWADLSEDQIIRRVSHDISVCFPEAPPGPCWSRVVRERRATWAATPHFEAVRPLPGLSAVGDGALLAGDYTAIDWPATMEGAARSGFHAATAAMAALG